MIGNGNGWRWHKLAQRVAREYGRNLEPSDWCVYYSLVMAADNNTGACFPSKKSIADTWGLSRRTVDAAMERLLAHRPALLQVTRHRTQRGEFAANDYQLLDPFDEQPSPSTSGASLPSSMGQLNVEIVSAQNLRVDHAQILHIPSEDSAHGPRAEIARGEPLDEWQTVRAKLDGRLGDAGFLRQLDELDRSCFRLCEGRIVIFLPHVDLVHQAQRHKDKIAGIAARVLKVSRDVVFLDSSQAGNHGSQ